MPYWFPYSCSALLLGFPIGNIVPLLANLLQADGDPEIEGVSVEVSLWRNRNCDVLDAVALIRGHTNPNGARLRLYAHNAQFGEVTVGGQDPAETCYFPLVQ